MADATDLQPSGTSAEENMLNITGAADANVDEHIVDSGQSIVGPGLDGLSQTAQSNVPLGLGPDFHQMPTASTPDQFSQMADPNTGWTVNNTFTPYPAVDQNAFPAAPTYSLGGKAGPGAMGGIVGAASSVLGQPYRLGATIGSGAWDCGSLVSWAFAQNGIQGVPRYVPTLLQDSRFRNVSGGLAQAKPGDVLFPTGGYGTTLGSHVVLYIGGGQIIEAPHPGAGVRIMPANEYSGYVVKRYAG